MSSDIVVKTWIGTALDDTAGAAAQADGVAAQFVQFVAQAAARLDIAIYDWRLDPAQATPVVDALNALAARGVAVRVAYFDQPPAKAAKAGRDGGDPTPGMRAADLARLHKDIERKAIAGVDVQDLPANVRKQPIEGGGHLMHSKYMVRDGNAVWMGSANFTTAAWSVQDNNIVQVRSPALAACYSTDFDELWQNGRIAGTGKNDTGSDTVDGSRIDCAFSPGDGSTIEKEIAGAIMGAQATVHIASMVISSGAILGALVDALGRKVALTGVYDGPQMQVVLADWAKGGAAGKSAGKAQQWKVVAAQLVAKASAPYTPAGPHNFMHNKLAVVDRRQVVTGSFNFSQNATHNAENVLDIHDPVVAGQYADYVEALVRTYRVRKPVARKSGKAPAKRPARKTSARRRNG
jgi:phosphatidylserine/phosphatidylglycerophosphate/cardiolipin synthase-like enzyme